MSAIASASFNSEPLDSIGHDGEIHDGDIACLARTLRSRCGDPKPCGRRKIACVDPSRELRLRSSRAVVSASATEATAESTIASSSAASKLRTVIKRTGRQSRSNQHIQAIAVPSLTAVANPGLIAGAGTKYPRLIEPIMTSSDPVSALLQLNHLPEAQAVPARMLRTLQPGIQSEVQQTCTGNSPVHVINVSTLITG